MVEKWAGKVGYRVLVPGFNQKGGRELGNEGAKP